MARKADQQGSLFEATGCAYGCGRVSQTRDHAPPKSLLVEPFPSNLHTLPVCLPCNGGYSWCEGAVRALLMRIRNDTGERDWSVASKAVERALIRDARLKALIEGVEYRDGAYVIGEELYGCVWRVVRKAVQGLYHGLYNRVVREDELDLLSIEDRRRAGPEDVADRNRPPILEDLASHPLPEIYPSSRFTLVFLDVIAPDGTASRRAFRMVRETPIEWIELQAGVFTYAFVKSAQGSAVCILELWKTLVIAVECPWPGDRGTKRRGRKNPLSRDK